MRIVPSVGAVPALAIAAVAFAATPANAQGQTERGPEHANSICSYSGLNDDPMQDGMRVQSYGALVAAGFIRPSEVRSGAPSPGFFCNGHRFPLQELQDAE